MAQQNYYSQTDQIADRTLRDKVNLCWTEALRRGGWERGDLDAIPFSLLAASSGVSLREHTEAVTKCSILLGETLRDAYSRLFTIEWDILVAGAILHDVGKPLEYARTPEGSYVVSPLGRLIRHPISGANLAAELGLPDKVVHIIAVHSKEGDGGYRSPEAWIIHHADFVNFEPIRNR